MSKINQNWVFGDKSGLSFANIGSPQPISSSLVISSGHNEGCASISDNNGTLLFYTNGINIWRGDHSLLTGTNGIPTLSGNNSSTQSAIIVPHPAHHSKYYIFTADSVSGNNHVKAYLLDIVTETGMVINIYGSSIQETGYTHTEKVTAIQKPDCKGFWVITIVFKNPSPKSSDYEGFFRVWEVDSSGVLPLSENTMNVFYPPPPPNLPLPFPRGGYLKGSPNGQLIANANGNHVVVYDFNNLTGQITIPGRETLSHPQLGEPNLGVYGVEFSPNSLNLFYGNQDRIGGTSNKGRIYHVDLDPNNIAPLTRTQVGGDIDNDTASVSDGNYVIGALQLAIDGKIYFAKDRVSELGAIENPDLGLGCTVYPTEISWLSTDAGTCRLGLPNLLPNPCKDDAPCNCGCAGCNENAEEQNKDLIDRAKTKFNVIKSKNSCGEPFTGNCDKNVIPNNVILEPCFYFHWGDSSNDQIEEHDTEVFYITVCNDFNDIQYNGLSITKITLIPDQPIDKVHIVPDRFINLDCLEPCSCQTREFAMITRATDTAGTYKMEVEYCFESVEITSKPKEGKVEFGFEITED